MKQDPSLHDLLFFSSVSAQLDTARRLHDQLQTVLTADPVFSRLQANLRHLSTALAAQMSWMQLGDLCSHCAATDGGGCCSSEMAGETDAVQILINLLAGIEVRTMHTDRNACCFLGAGGCIFAFKPMFCLNYNCAHIRRQNSQAQMRRLEERAGRLLSAQYRLERYLLEVIAGEGLPSRK